MMIELKATLTRETVLVCILAISSTNFLAAPRIEPKEFYYWTPFSTVYIFLYIKGKVAN